MIMGESNFKFHAMSRRRNMSKFCFMGFISVTGECGTIVSDWLEGCW